MSAPAFDWDKYEEEEIQRLTDDLHFTHDIGDYAKQSAEVERRIAKRLGIHQERNPWQEAADEIASLRAKVTAMREAVDA